MYYIIITLLRTQANGTAYSMTRIVSKIMYLGKNWETPRGKNATY